MRVPFAKLALVTLAILFAMPSSVYGQAIPLNAAGTPDLKTTMDAIDADIALLASNDEIEATQKTNLEGLFQRAKTALQDAQKLSDISAQYKTMVANVAKDIAAVGASMEAQSKQDPDPKPDESIDAVSQRLAVAKSELSQATAAAAELTAEAARRKKRLTEIPAEQSTANQTRTEIREQLGQIAPANETELETKARETLLNARLVETENRIEVLQDEQAAYLATTELLPQRILLGNSRVKRLRSEVEKLQTVLAEKQSSQARDDTRDLKKTAAQVPVSLRGYAESNVRLKLAQQKLIQDSALANERLDNIQVAFEDVKSDLKTSEERIKALGLTDALGIMLRETREHYEQLRIKYRPFDNLKEKSQQYQLEAFRLEDEAKLIDERLAEAEERSIDWQAENIDWSKLSQSDAEWVLMNRRGKLIGEVMQAQNGLLQTLLTGDTQERQLLLEIDRFNAFVDRNLFWTRSAPVFSMKELEQAPESVAWFVQLSNWRSSGNSAVASIQYKPLKSLLLIAATIGLMFCRPRLRRIIHREGESAKRFSAGYKSTVITFAATALSAATWPVVFATLNYLLLSSPTGNVFSRAVGTGFGVVAIFIASRELLKETCRNQGLAEAHFGWADSVRLHLRRHLRWYMILGGIGIFVMVTLHDHPDVGIRAFGSRITSTFLFVVTAAFHHFVFRSRSPIYAQVVRTNPQSVVYRYRNLIWWVAVGLPFSFAIMSMAGYLETTFRLGRSLQSTFLLFVAIVLVLGLVSRWLTLHRRDVSLKRARENRERRSKLAETKGEMVASETGIDLEEEMSADLPTLDYQTRQTAFTLACILGCVVLAYIWSDVLPALEFFDAFSLWDVGTGDAIESVTLLDVFYSVLAIAGLFFATRNLPSMLELLVLSRTSLDSGARYAITTLLRYVVFVVGGFIVLNLLSVPYQQLGWLVAAVSVGLGFGLQEIVANFVSGIILLLERPVRVGDVVTIDGTTGTVSRIHMRATTVTSWDRKELVVPNKDLITQKLLNWSLSNVINRLTIEVGVEYGADPDKVRGILYRVVTQNPEVMKDPAPLINLETFGDSSLNFLVRFYLPKLDNRIEITHQINSAIARELEAAGISIPFPQRDLNFKLGDDKSHLPIEIKQSGSQKK